MSITSQQYADLASHVYRPAAPGTFSPNGGPEVVAGGVKFILRAHVDNPKTGYQGSIYQRADTGELVVAHRGTEFDREPVKDGALADGGMVLDRSNLQAEDAIALTRQALKMASDESLEKGHPPQPVTTTGHSLGGTLAQVSAHHFDLHGETFNAYGAVSLNRRIPEGGHSVVNHVMAGDVVSAACAHFGQVRIYARQQEVQTLLAHGYDNKTHLSDALRGYSPVHVAAGMTPPSTIRAAIAMGDSHSMHHFVGVDAAGKPDLSILADPQARHLALQQSVQIGEYRQDVRQMRGVLTAVSRGIDGAATDVFDALRGPLAPGEPGMRKHNGASIDPASLSPGARLLIDDSREHVQRLARAHGLPWDQGMENTVLAVAQKASEAGLSRVSLLKVDAGEIRLVDTHDAPPKEARLDARQAANIPTEVSVQKLTAHQEPEHQMAAAKDAPARSMSV